MLNTLLFCESSMTQLNVIGIKKKYTDSDIKKDYRSLQDRVKIEREETYRWLVCSWSLESCVGWEPERRSRQMAWRAATSRAKPCRATIRSATRASHPSATSHARNSRNRARTVLTMDWDQDTVGSTSDGTDQGNHSRKLRYDLCYPRCLKHYETTSKKPAYNEYHNRISQKRWQAKLCGRRLT